MRSSRAADIAKIQTDSSAVPHCLPQNGADTKKTQASGSSTPTATATAAATATEPVTPTMNMAGVRVR